MTTKSLEVESAEIRLGVLFDRDCQQLWMLNCIRRAVGVDGVILQRAVRVGLAPQSALLSQIAISVNRILEPPETDRDAIFGTVDIAAELNVVCSDLSASVIESLWIPQPSSAEIISRADIDVWLCFTTFHPSKTVDFASSSVWGIDVGSNIPAASEWAGFPEIASGSPVTMVSLVDYRKGNILYRSFGATHGSSALRSRRQALTKGVAFPERVLKARGRGERGINLSKTLDAPSSYPLQSKATFSQVARIAFRMTALRALNKIPKWHALPQWQIGYYFASADEQAGFQFDRIRYLVPPRDRFWADPFSIHNEGRDFIFVEELPYSTQRGRIVAIEVFEDREPGPSFTVLERPYHLSYPFLFWWQDVLYMLPETGENRTIEVYKCVEFPHRWEFDRVLIDQIHAFDATLWMEQNTWWMFANVAEPGADPNDELHLFRGTTPFGPWTPHRDNPVVSDVRVARGAGPVFADKSSVCRPSQDCSIEYGYSVSINTIENLNDAEYSETPSLQVLPTWHPKVSRVHTVGATGRVRVVDCMVTRPRWE